MYSLRFPDVLNNVLHMYIDKLRNLERLFETGNNVFNAV